MSDLKQIIVIRTDLKMNRGKEVAQGAHASVNAVVNHLDDPNVREWLRGSHAKIAVRASSEEELLALHGAALDAGLPASLVRDEGRTAFHGRKTYTAAAIGPGDPGKIEAITGDLKLR